MNYKNQLIYQLTIQSFATGKDATVVFKASDSTFQEALISCLVSLAHIENEAHGSSTKEYPALRSSN